ncbi:Acyl-CoA thioesterase [Sulfidibacter corallicola]|uniref:Acyl-CoA thioesterase n=1 Tax=Sulfidibacter corallicola TaxID=2818388 RepID=A0A8A4TTG3_SULCO|nr:thioesterase family protein [Sulfidibacter corallicola]QTD52378.1 acyl-CoA thioesterase [Sulfidibacter corallicola]
MTEHAEFVVEIPFHDIDLMRVVWHGHYYKYFELARTELFRRHHLDIDQMKELGLMFPVIESHCRYVSSLKYGETAVIRARMVEVEYRLKVTYQVFEATTERRVAKGYTIQVAVNAETGEMHMATPPVIRDLFEA